MYQIYVYIPLDSKERVKEAMFAAGAGTIGNYTRCAFEYEGWGQFQPEEGSHPTLGAVGSLEAVKEIKVEMICEDVHLQKVLIAMKLAHPYEEPAFGAFKILTK